MYFVNDLNLKKQARELGISVWQTPGFLFLVMGAVSYIVMTATYFISKNYNNPDILVISESVVATVMLIVGNGMVRIVGQMAKVNKLKSDFVSVASHQLRTPLSAIIWETELLLSKNKRGLSEKQMRSLQIISSLSGRMTRLVNDLLDVTRIDQKRLILRKEMIDIVEIAEKTIKDLSSLALSRNINITFNYNEKRIPKIMGDPERTRLVVENLLNNAIKYVVKKGKIEIKIVRRDNYIVFSIRDNGVGIPEEQQDQVFEKFFRSDNIVKYQTEGTGLGLYIAKNIIEQTGGKIWFQSIENVGSVFSFSLPIK
ncbi:MAG TPA: HAMP domain-containing sensor histidine kinase [Patescibacteria group bacterium]|nr:HAMP domain-containing sensor histidine kinase [Patescibacteria group bacterium]HLP48472.1 HAMP domain-containing sensor histidine kinase [Candidatus Kapabacteria bacterium]